MFDRWLDSSRWLWCALSGLLLVASFAPFSCATCGWISLIPAWCVITRSERARRQPIRHGYLIGLIYFGGVFWWISNVTAVGMFFLILYLALYPAIWFFLLVRLVMPKPGEGSALVRACAAAALWVVLEWWRSWFLTGFNWNELGISQAPSIVFRQLAAYGGVHLISFVLVLVNILWAEGILDMMERFRQKRDLGARLGRIDSLFTASIQTSSIAAALLIIALSFALGVHHLQRHSHETPGTDITFACVQPNIPQIPPGESGTEKEFEDREQAALDKTENLTIQAIAKKPQILIWPEATIDEGVFQDRPLNQAVHDICLNYNGAFLLGSQDFDQEAHKVYNCAYLFTSNGDGYQEYRKTRLVILGEFLPFGDTFPWLRRELGMGMDFSPGPGPVRFEIAKDGPSFAPLICFEDTLAEVADKAVRLKPDFFVTITNDGWYTGWFAAWGVRQHLNHAVFRCIEHDRPMIRCANTGISCVIDQNGTVTDRYRDASGAELDIGGIFTGNLSFYPTHGTVYQSWGDWIVLISSLLTVMLGIRFFAFPQK